MFKKPDRSKDRIICVNCESAKLPSEKCEFVRKNIQIHTERKHPGCQVKFRIPNVTSISSIFKPKDSSVEEPELKKVKLGASSDTAGRQLEFSCR